MNKPQQKPPVPPENRSPKGGGSDPDVTNNDASQTPDNPDQTGQRANTRQNTPQAGRHTK